MRTHFVPLLIPIEVKETFDDLCKEEGADSKGKQLEILIKFYKDNK